MKLDPEIPRMNENGKVQDICVGVPYSIEETSLQRDYNTLSMKCKRTPFVVDLFKRNHISILLSVLFLEICTAIFDANPFKRKHIFIPLSCP